MNSGSTDGWETVDEDDDSMGDSADGDQQLPQSTYLYTPLRDAGRHIRVLSLAPADWEEPLVGSFEETSIIDGQGEYEALSYCWTSTEDCHPGRSLLRSTWKHYPIHIEDRVLYVGRNLYEALRRRRERQQHPKIWADAVCINQDDNNERTEQVAQMGMIYAKAGRTLIWLHLLRLRRRPLCLPVIRRVSGGQFPPLRRAFLSRQVGVKPPTSQQPFRDCQ